MIPTEEESIALKRRACFEESQQIAIVLQALGVTRSKLEQRAKEAQSLDEMAYLYRSLVDLRRVLSDLLFS